MCEKSHAHALHVIINESINKGREGVNRKAEFLTNAELEQRLFETCKNRKMNSAPEIDGERWLQTPVLSLE